MQDYEDMSPTEKEIYDRGRKILKDKGITFTLFKSEIKRLKPDNRYTEDDFVFLFNNCACILAMTKEEYQTLEHYVTFLT